MPVMNTVEDINWAMRVARHESGGYLMMKILQFKLGGEYDYNVTFRFRTTGSKVDSLRLPHSFHQPDKIIIIHTLPLTEKADLHRQSAVPLF
jgi:hypothetical protein